ncbi:hypothetical protein QJS10_CPB20g00479 [Acorus calamus]|uniref:Neprosin PEP catalytic domain-containing protein n=1 Tax=Acorus calamus TaxID=4465 RepID=A0AAV9C9T9_ACOCL|nr:hypothetical protein QJS10_CPB20g00479 [Acorus calamus]
MKEIDRMLKVLNKPAIKTIKSVDGDIIDCVDIYKQPAFDHPLLYNHTIQMRPSAYPKGVEAETTHAVVTTNEDKYFGGRADVHVWNPRVYGENEFSLAQIWILSQDRAHTLEAGWMSDEYRTTGCYNLECSGFVQVNSEYVIGGAIGPVSVYGGHQFYLTFSIFQDVENGNWWLQQQNSLIGYWPGSLDPKFAGGADIVEYGGEIVNGGVAFGTGGPHTSTEMGSGHFPGEGEGKAAAFSNLQVMDKDKSGYKSPQDVTPYVGMPYCYDLSLMKTTSNWGVFFFYGGPGRNQDCP